MILSLQPFELPNGTYTQEDYYVCIPPYFEYVKNYNLNLLQFSNPTRYTTISNYISTCNAYIENLFVSIPIPHANPWNIYSPFIEPPTPPDTTGWEQDQIDIVVSITNSTFSLFVIANEWINFVIVNEQPPIYMTDEEAWNIANSDYASLLIKQYYGLPVATKTISYFAYWILLNIKSGFDLIRGYNPWYAVGKQLDVVGNYFGLSRNISFTTAQGVPYTQLNDSQFRIVIMFSILQWSCNFSYGGLSNAVYKIFKDQIIISSSKQDMTLSYYIIAPIGSDMYVAICALVSQNKIPAPLGVAVRYIILSPTPKPVFSFAWSDNFANPTLANKGFGWSNRYYQNIFIWAGNITSPNEFIS